jgi:hypothetical protein
MGASFVPGPYLMEWSLVMAMESRASLPVMARPALGSATFAAGKATRSEALIYNHLFLCKRFPHLRECCLARHYL